MSMKEALYYEAQKEGRVRCRLCPHNCTIDEGATGICGVRRNTRHKLFTEIYGEVTSMAMDPVEKKPLYHFYPSRQILSIGTKGCNLKCPYCQNWQISQNTGAGSRRHAPREIVETALRRDSVGIAYTYSEPVIWIEFVLDTARAARAEGLKNVLVTNGYINPEPLDELLTVTDAVNIDLKCYDEGTYRRVQKGGLPEVKAAIARCHEKGCHVEITTLIVTGMNDNRKEMEGIADFIASLDRNIPWHISRYYPNYQYQAPSTSIGFMKETYEAASKKLNFVYCGNIQSSLGSDTVCPSCGDVLIERMGYHTVVKSMKDGACGNCGYETGIVR